MKSVKKGPKEEREGKEPKVWGSLRRGRVGLSSEGGGGFKLKVVKVNHFPQRLTSECLVGGERSSEKKKNLET